MSGQDCEQLTLFPADSPASRSVWPGSGEARRMTVTSGRKCLELSRSCGPLGSLERMLLESSAWRSTRCYLTWKVSATPAKRLLFRLVPSTPRTGGTDVQSWPTPTAADSYTGRLKSTQQKPGSMHSVNLSDAVAMFPTPTRFDAECGDLKGKEYNGQSRHAMKLIQAAKLYPTPTTGAGMCGGTGNYQQLKALEEFGQITEEERRSMAAGNGGQLNPTWVEWLMGFPLGWTDLNASETP